MAKPGENENVRVTEAEGDGEPVKPADVPSTSSHLNAETTSESPRGPRSCSRSASQSDDDLWMPGSFHEDDMRDLNLNVPRQEDTVDLYSIGRGSSLDSRRNRIE